MNRPFYALAIHLPNRCKILQYPEIIYSFVFQAPVDRLIFLTTIDSLKLDMLTYLAEERRLNNLTHLKFAWLLRERTNLGITSGCFHKRYKTDNNYTSPRSWLPWNTFTWLSIYNRHRCRLAYAAWRTVQRTYWHLFTKQGCPQYKRWHRLDVRSWSLEELNASEGTKTARPSWRIERMR